MSHLTGPRHGRSRETYQRAPGAGGAQAKLVPLTRQRFVDGGTTQLGLDGSVANPYKTIAQFMASRTNVSVADASANYVGWVMPALNGYTENVAFPAYVSTELRADSVTEAASNGAVITGNVAWANVGGAFSASPAICALHNVQVQGSMTVTDDVGAPTSLVIISCDEFLGGISTGFDSHLTTKLATVAVTNAAISGGINCGTATDSSVLSMSDALVVGNILAKSVVSKDTSITSAAITTNSSGICQFINTLFGDNTVLTTSLATFDGLSWMTFIANGGTRAAGTVVLVTGGFDGASVPGAALTAASTDVSLNGTGATAGYTGENSGNHYTTSNGTPTTVNLKTGGGELNGDTICITKTDLGANALAVKNNAAATIGTIPANERGSVVARFDGSDWVFDQGGSLAA